MNVPHSFAVDNETKEITNNSYGSTIGPSFKPIGIREIWDEQEIREKRLNDEEIQELINDPLIKKSTRLQELSKKINEDVIAKVPNMIPISDTANSIIDIINDLLDFNPNSGLHEFMNIFINDNRLIHIGLVIVLFTIIIWAIRFIDNFSI